MSEDKNSSKGQIFTLDVLAAVLGITILLGITVQYQVMIKNRGSDIEYTEMNTIASDAAQIAVKKEAVKEHRVNTIKSPNNLNGVLSNLTGDKYDYQVTGALQIMGDQGCGNKKKVASVRRIVKNESGDADHLTVEVCTR